MAEGVKVMAELMEATQVAREAQGKRSLNGVLYASFGENGLDEAELARMVQAIPVGIAAALKKKAYYFVPLAIAEGRGGETGGQTTMVAPRYSTALADEAICHRNVALGAGEGGDGGEGVFISARLMNDRFALAFEFFINVGHAFVDEAGVSAGFAELVWNQAANDVRGETSMDAWESRAAAMGRVDGQMIEGRPRIDEKAKTEYLTAAFSDAVAIYLLSLTVDFDYSELREREYPLLAPQALAERLKMVAQLFPPNEGYEFAIKYRRRG